MLESYQDLLEEQLQQKVKLIWEQARYLANDCGGCETCERLFTPNMHTELLEEIKKLPKRLQTQFEVL